MKTILKYIVAVITVMMINDELKAQACTVSAGSNQSTCCSVTIGGAPTAGGGCSPYQYAWSPSTGLSCVTCPNPVASPGSTTTYTVSVTFQNNCCSNCQPQCVRSASCTVTITGNCCRIANPESQTEVENSNINLFPNPTSGKFNLEFSEVSANTSVHVYDVTGNAIWAKENFDEGSQSTEIDLSNEAKGTYFVLIKNADATSMYKKVVVQ